MEKKFRFDAVMTASGSGMSEPMQTIAHIEAESAHEALMWVANSLPTDMRQADHLALAFECLGEVT